MNDIDQRSDDRTDSRNPRRYGNPVDTTADRSATLQSERQSGRRRFIVLSIVLLGFALAGTIYWLHARQFVTTNDAQIDGPIHQIAPRIAGSVLAVEVRDYQHVSKGQVLLRLDPATEQVALGKAEAKAAQADAEISLREADLAKAKADVAVAEADLAKAKQDNARYHRVNPQAITKADLDAAAAALRAATARANAAEQQALGAKAALTAATASAKAEDVAVEDAKLQLSYTEIRAPASGYIAQKTVRAGNIVAPGTPLMALVGEQLWVTANYKETQLADIRIGQSARVYIDAIPGIAFHARVAAIQRGTGSVFSLLPAENATGNYVKVVQRVPVRLVFDDPRIKDHAIAPGMSAEPYIRISTK